MGYFQFRYDSIVVIYYCRGFIRLATDGKNISPPPFLSIQNNKKILNSTTKLAKLGSQISPILNKPALGKLPKTAKLSPKW